MEEIFYKMEIFPIKRIYQFLLKEFNRNMNIVCEKINPSYDRRIPILKEKMEEKRVPVNKLHLFPFKEGISYISIRNGTAIVNYAPMNSKLYTENLKYSRKYKVKLDDMIKNSLEFKYQAKTFIVRAMHDKNNDLVKLEYQDKNFLNELKGKIHI